MNSLALADSIAIVGLAGRFPGAANVDEFWRNLCDGVESIRPVAKHQRPPEAARDPNYVPAVAMLDGFELFDAEFFGYTARQAELMDPQHRLLLECAWTALENAGYDADRFSGAIGVFAGATLNSYLYANLLQDPVTAGSLDPLELNITNGPDFLATRLSYKLNLRGPSHGVQCACSTSLVAVHTACQSLICQECDMALAGGVSVNLMFRNGYRYVPGGITSPDGRCRAFDASGQGTIFGGGVGVVVLRRLEDAIASRDHIVAVIRGSAVNNDGGLKVGYTAPSIDGQAAVISEALARAAVSAESIGYVEAHGTATPLGDPIEVAALSRAFALEGDRTRSCAIGSVKTNVGHLDAAAGVTGLIKTALLLHHAELVPSLHFNQPNPEIAFEHTPFYVSTARTHWNTEGGPRRAGVSAFGVGGTNAHVVLEEPPAREPSNLPEKPQLVIFSAKSAAALEAVTRDVDQFLSSGPEINLADVAYTLAAGRKFLVYRRAQVRSCKSRDTILSVDGLAEGSAISPSFLFPGQSAQKAGMGSALYRTERCFREALETCARLIRTHSDLDLVGILGAGSDSRLDDTCVTQPALFAVEYALARLWQSWGIQPARMLGHSLGEYVAACLAGVFSLDDAIRIVTTRAMLMQNTEQGAMLSVELPAGDLAALHLDGVDLAAVNAPLQCVLSGSCENIAVAEKRMAAEQIPCRRLRTSRAFHSALMDPVVKPLRDVLKGVELHPPSIPFFSNLTGRAAGDEVTNAEYWIAQLRETVRFDECAEALLENTRQALLEVGPGDTLLRLVRRNRAYRPETVLAPCMTGAGDAEHGSLLGALGRVWANGVSMDWEGFYAPEHRRRIPCPTYPFQRQRYWIEMAGRPGTKQTRSTSTPDATEPCRYIWSQQPSLPMNTGAHRACQIVSFGEDPWAPLLRRELGQTSSSGTTSPGTIRERVTVVGAGSASPERLRAALSSSGEGACYVVLSGAAAVIPAEDLDAAACRARCIAERHKALVIDAQPADERTARHVAAYILGGGADALSAFRSDTRWTPELDPIASVTGSEAKDPRQVIITGSWSPSELQTWRISAEKLYAGPLTAVSLDSSTRSSGTIFMQRNGRQPPAILYFAGDDPETRDLDRLDALVAACGATRCVLIPQGHPTEEAQCQAASLRAHAHNRMRAHLSIEWSSIEWRVPENTTGVTLADAQQQALGRLLPLLEMVRDVTVLHLASPGGQAPASAAPTHLRPQLRTQYVAPASPAETRIAQVWESLLGISGIGALDNFFDLGADSAIALQCASQLEQVLGNTIAVAMLYEAPNIRALAAALDNGGSTALSAGDRARRAAERRDVQLRARRRG